MGDSGESFKQRDAGSYDDVTESFDRFTVRFTSGLAERMVELAALGGEQRVLDVGTGTGVVALAAARRLTGAGSVLGVDLSAGMLDFARRAADAAGLSARVHLARMDAEDLSLPDAGQDVVVSLYALLHFPHPERALAQMHRVLRPGGRLVLAIGRAPPRLSAGGLAYLGKRLPLVLRLRRGEWLAAPAFLEGLLDDQLPGDRRDEESALAHGGGHGHGLASDRVLRLVRDAGFRDVRSDWAAETDVLDDPEEFWELQRTFSSIARKRLADADPAAVMRLHDTFVERCRAVQSRGGRLVYPYAAFFVSARRV